MKKLKLKALELGATEVLTRAQLKNVMGGDGSTGDYEDGNYQCGSLGNCQAGRWCTFQSGRCAGWIGTCGTWDNGQHCGCMGSCH